MNLPRLNNLTDLAELLRSLDDTTDRTLGFDMEYEYSHRKLSKHDCGSACCIGGWVQACNTETRTLDIEDAVMSLVDYNSAIHINQAHKLCYPDLSVGAWTATAKQAARAVEILRDTGECDWERAIEEA
jgi:hypothetical protein